MAKSSRLQIRIAPDVKKRSEELFESLGMNMSSAVNLFIEQSLRVGGLPFPNDSEKPVNSEKTSVNS